MTQTVAFSLLPGNDCSQRQTIMPRSLWQWPLDLKVSEISDFSYHQLLALAIVPSVLAFLGILPLLVVLHNIWIRKLLHASIYYLFLACHHIYTILASCLYALGSLPTP